MYIQIASGSNALLPTTRTTFRPTVIELFAGGGGLALGFEAAGFEHVLLNEFDKDCCKTLRYNRPTWPVFEKDIKTVDFLVHRNQVDVVAGGFPCQAFSVAGRQEGFADKRGALFFEYARAVQEINPKLFIAENVKHLLYHNKGKTIETMLRTLTNFGYNVLPPKVLCALDYQVPQKRERVFIVGVREDIGGQFIFPTPDENSYNLSEALKTGALYDCDVPASSGLKYSKAKFKILSQVPEGGNWRDLPVDMQQQYLKERYKKGSNSQFAMRLSWGWPCYTLITNPNSKLIERCHPDETRPLTIREYARVQTFPDDWEFIGPMVSQYRQIGNAVPVNFAKAVAQSAKDFLSTLKIIV